MSKRVPARTKTIEFNWLAKSFTTMTPRFRQIRSGMRNKMDSCYWCGHQFADGEEFALGQLKKPGGNKAFCHDCADQALASVPEGVGTMAADGQRWKE